MLVWSHENVCVNSWICVCEVRPACVCMQRIFIFVCHPVPIWAKSRLCCSHSDSLLRSAAKPLMKDKQPPHTSPPFCSSFMFPSIGHLSVCLPDDQVPEENPETLEKQSWPCSMCQMLLECSLFSSSILLLSHFQDPMGLPLNPSVGNQPAIFYNLLSSLFSYKQSRLLCCKYYSCGWNNTAWGRSQLLFLWCGCGCFFLNMKDSVATLRINNVAAW